MEPATSVTFTVALPGLTTVSPNSGVRGTAVSVTLTGTNLSAATGINISGTGVTPSGLTVVNDTTVTATFTITSTAGLGNHNVSVVTPSRLQSAPFTVQGATLRLDQPDSTHSWRSSVLNDAYRHKPDGSHRRNL